MTELKDGGESPTRSEALRRVMQSKCKKWPYVTDDELLADKWAKLECVARWVKHVSKAATQLSQGEFWHSMEGESISGIPMQQKVGRLCAIAPMPKAIAPLFAGSEDNWHLEIRRFSGEVNTELKRLEKAMKLTFFEVFYFYKRVNALSTNPPPFIAKLRAAQDRIKARHGKCKCIWARKRGGWIYHWLRADPDGWPYFGCTCPYDIALEELEFGWGNTESLLSNRKAFQEKCIFLQSSKLLRDAGLIEYTPDSNVSSEGYLVLNQKATPYCEWARSSPLNDLLNAAAEFEIETAINGLTSWLDDIDNGLAPTTRDDPRECVRLREVEGELMLINWQRVRGHKWETRYVPS